jgi:hypothetical protein
VAGNGRHVKVEAKPTAAVGFAFTLLCILAKRMVNRLVGHFHWCVVQRGVGRYRNEESWILPFVNKPQWRLTRLR